MESSLDVSVAGCLVLMTGSTGSAQASIVLQNVKCHRDFRQNSLCHLQDTKFPEASVTNYHISERRIEFSMTRVQKWDGFQPASVQQYKLSALKLYQHRTFTARCFDWTRIGVLLVGIQLRLQVPFLWRNDLFWCRKMAQNGFTGNQAHLLANSVKKVLWAKKTVGHRGFGVWHDLGGGCPWMKQEAVQRHCGCDVPPDQSLENMTPLVKN